jgi:uncharacterized membrane protein (UPF0182 family)
VDQIGSKVILGNLLVIPLADTLLYVEPLYLRAENGQLPELQRVLASYGDRTVMGDDLESTLAALFTGTKNGAPVVAKSAPPPQAAVVVAAARAASAGAAPGNVTSDLQGAASHYNRASQALRHGDWTQFADEMQKLGQNLGQPGKSMHH